MTNGANDQEKTAKGGWLRRLRDGVLDLLHALAHLRLGQLRGARLLLDARHLRLVVRDEVALALELSVRGGELRNQHARTRGGARRGGSGRRGG